MSMSEIADNKWELDAAKPPTTTFGGICQILLITAFALIFVYIFQGSARGLFGAKTRGRNGRHLRQDGSRGRTQVIEHSPTVARIVTRYERDLSLDFLAETSPRVP
jgi:hypothetical protein